MKSIYFIISQFDLKLGFQSWGWKNKLEDNELNTHISATWTSSNNNRYPIKGLIIIQTPIDNTKDIALTWFIILFNGWNLKEPFSTSHDSTLGSFGGFTINSILPNLNVFCSNLSILNKIASKQGQYLIE